MSALSGLNPSCFRQDVLPAPECPISANWVLIIGSFQHDERNLAKNYECEVTGSKVLKRCLKWPSLGKGPKLKSARPAPVSTSFNYAANIPSPPQMKEITTAQFETEV